MNDIFMAKGKDEVLTRITETLVQQVQEEHH